jgi:2-keto-4-pentenoate hydratase/2-oxohepta-3-ene-1,7-dioic acid hydratase in catechol pathway
MLYKALLGGGDRNAQFTSKVVCIGRNYAAHAQELNNPIPSSPLLFIKPESAIQDLTQAIYTPKGEVHYEAELCLLIGEAITVGQLYSDEQLWRAIQGMGLGLDLTLRKVQSTLKEKGQPWERAKSFDGACVLSHFVPNTLPLAKVADAHFTLHINEGLRQHGYLSQMLFPIVHLLRAVIEQFSLRAGDIVMTGTPSGVGVLHAGDRVDLNLYSGDERLIAATGSVA